LDSSGQDGRAKALTGEVGSQGSWPQSLRRMVRNGAAVLAAILIAFGLDAWWTNRDEVERVDELLLSIAEEFETATEQLDSILNTNDRWLATSIAFLARTELGSPPLPLDSVRHYATTMYDPFQIYDPAFGAVSTLIHSGGLGRVSDLEIQQALGGWEGELKEHDHELQLLALTVRRVLEAMSSTGATSVVVVGEAMGSRDDSETWLQLARDDGFRQAIAEAVFVVNDYQQELRRTRRRAALLASRLGS
jgi:hypothetical protein